MTSALWERHKKELLAKLSRDIPPPKAKVAKPTKSFRGLKPGDRVSRNLDSKVFKVVLVDSLHASIMEETPRVEALEIDSANLGVDWELGFTKVKKERKGGKVKEV